MSWNKGSTYGFDSDPAGRWRKQAACIDYDPELWFPVSTSPTAPDPAKRVCSRCPVQDECLAAGRREADGIWGGQTPKERRRETPTVSRPADLVCEACGDVYRPSLPGICRCPPCRIGGLQPCGTVAAYYRHPQGEACDPCKEAKRRKSATDRASRARRRVARRVSS